MKDENSENEKKESSRVLLNRSVGGRQPVVSVRRRPASSSDAASIERAIDELLAELVRQARAHRRKRHDD